MIIGGLVLTHLYDVTPVPPYVQNLCVVFRSFECYIVRKRWDLNMLDDYLVIEEPHIVEIVDL
jgi:hypothetical protein